MAGFYVNVAELKREDLKGGDFCVKKYALLIFLENFALAPLWVILKP